ncbi:hypothetical protein KKE34_02885 [Patescibacteria group bacterium]|nr:hypothetical protein [Patescibacteria group bacterium]MBU1885534.1 hypothetical protein [Patescibacteria group bacterium]
MPKINKDDILGYEADGDYYCASCAKSRGKDDEVKHDKLLTKDIMDRNEVYYCKDCGKKIGSGSSGSGGGLF